jgi:transcriptional regulator with XRE-family HTH domain
MTMSDLQGKTYGTRIAFLRERNGMSVERLAELTGINAKRLVLIEKDERDVRLTEALNIARHLNEPIDNFAILERFAPRPEPRSH